MLLIPVLLWSRRLRLAAAVCVAQLAFYLWVYSTSPVDTESYVNWSFPRLLLHVLPALWVLGAMIKSDTSRAEDNAGPRQESR